MADAITIKKESFRDALSTVDKEGKRVWVYPKKPKGKLTNARTLVSFLFLGIFFAIPFIRIQGEPLLLINIIERKFIFFGSIFWPQDFHFLLIGMIAFIIFIVIFTLIYGRVFCGWVCPQTIFMEMVFRKIEYWIEGDYKTQVLLDKAPMSSAKFAKKTLKHSLFFILSFVIANTFLIYFIGSDTWFHIVKDPVSSHASGFISIIVFTLTFYFVYAKFREQICTSICPYGRLQGVLLDKNSLVVVYDFIRGEGRSKIKKNEDRKAAAKGDCIDCNQCVNVCPTGIDIRNGTQLECINCTACIDACNFMMKKVGLAEGLIRLASEEQIMKREKFKLSTRMISLNAILLIIIAGLIALFSLRSDIETTVLRTPGILFQEQADNHISNLYSLKIINKTNLDIPLSLKVENTDAQIKMVGKDLIVNKQSYTDGAFFILLPKGAIKTIKTKLKIGVYSGSKKMETIKTTFIGPVQ